MNIFRRSLSSASHKSPRTTQFQTHIPLPSQPQLPQTPTPPLLTLPTEILRLITTYLPPSSAAAFSLTSRWIYYSLGTQHLTTHLHTNTTRFEQRARIEALVERAFPGHWFCAWCDGFHAWEAREGPRDEVKGRECEVGNSYLDAGRGGGGGGGDWRYVLRFQHVRLAVNAVKWGDEHGIKEGLFALEHTAQERVLGCSLATYINIAAKVQKGRLLLCARYTIVLPRFLTRQKRLLAGLWGLIPHVVAGHRDSENGHTGLMAAVDNVLRRGWTYKDVQTCGMCRTDWSVRAEDVATGKGGSVRLVVEAWRDLGTGRNPFETAWRAHGVGVHGGEGKVEIARLKGVHAGDVRRAFEDEENGDGIGDVEVLGVKRSRSLSPVRIYRSFMRGESGEDAGSEARRSRARPRLRTTTTSEGTIGRRGDSRMEISRNVVEELIRL